MAKIKASHDLAYALLAGGEEALEMIGTAVFLYALLTCLGETPLAFTLRPTGSLSSARGRQDASSNGRGGG